MSLCCPPGISGADLVAEPAVSDTELIDCTIYLALCKSHVAPGVSVDEPVWASVDPVPVALYVYLVIRVVWSVMVSEV